MKHAADYGRATPPKRHATRSSPPHYRPESFRLQRGKAEHIAPDPASSKTGCPPRSALSGATGKPGRVPPSDARYRASRNRRSASGNLRSDSKAARRQRRHLRVSAAKDSSCFPPDPRRATMPHLRRTPRLRDPHPSVPPPASHIPRAPSDTASRSAEHPPAAAAHAPEQLENPSPSKTRAGRAQCAPSPKRPKSALKNKLAGN